MAERNSSTRKTAAAGARRSAKAKEAITAPAFDFNSSDPGPVTPARHNQIARREAYDLIERFQPWNLAKAAAFLLENPPTASAVAMLAQVAAELTKKVEKLRISQQNSDNAKGSHPDSRRTRILKLKIEHFDDMQRLAPDMINRKKGELGPKRRRRLQREIRAAWSVKKSP